MMTLAQAIEYGKRVGVRYYIKNEHDCIIGGYQTREKALEKAREMRNSGFGILHVEAVDEGRQEA